MATYNSNNACFYHPIKTIFLDDNLAFLEALELNFGDHLNMKTFTNSSEVLDFIDINNKYIYHSNFGINTNADSFSSLPNSFEIREVINYFYNSMRFNHVGILVIDYAMPDLNGIEFCLKLRDRNIFKIMLTGEADQNTAIRAFNMGIIDKFILKKENNLLEELQRAILELKNRYFSNLSRSTIDIIGIRLKQILENKSYKRLFDCVFNECQAVEYYLVDSSGSFVFFNKDAFPTWLIIRSTDELNEQSALLEGYDAEHIVSSKNSEKKILFLLTDREYKKPVKHWKKYVFSAAKLDENYYYAVINHKITDSIEWHKIMPYSRLGINIL